jgi:hypothetical protein
LIHDFSHSLKVCHPFAVPEPLANLFLQSVQEIIETSQIATVYNLRIGDYHTYFVGSREWGFAIWAPNVDCPPVTGLPDYQKAAYQELLDEHPN